MKALMLNADFRPFDIIPWQSAICKILKTSAYMVEDSSKKIRDSKGNKYAVPSVLALKKYRDSAHTHAAYSKKNVYLRDNFQCQYCATRLHENKTVDHVIPKSMGGKSKFTNVVACCYPCNSFKGQNTPEMANMTLLRSPRSVTISELFLIKCILFHMQPEWTKYFGYQKKTETGKVGGN